MYLLIKTEQTFGHKILAKGYVITEANNGGLNIFLLMSIIC